jgi:hypothetical protein
MVKSCKVTGCKVTNCMDTQFNYLIKSQFDGVSVIFNLSN